MSRRYKPYRHTGHEMQAMHGLNWIDNGARMRTVYDGGSFTTADPLCEKRPWLSPYMYCSGNPMNKIDPDGRYDLENIQKDNSYKAIAVFQSDYEKQGLTSDVAAAKKAGMPIMYVDNIKDYSNAMTALSDMGSSTSAYVINSHGREARFQIGSDIVGTETIQNVSELKAGLEGKDILISACNVTSGDGGKTDQGIQFLQLFSDFTSSRAISPDHRIGQGYTYDGSEGRLNKPTRTNYVEKEPDNPKGNSFHISNRGSDAGVVYNVTVDKNKGVNWNAPASSPIYYYPNVQPH